MSQRFDWKRSAVLLFKKLDAMPVANTSLASLHDLCARHEPAADLELALEYAICCRNAQVATTLCHALVARAVPLQPEPLLRAALWLTRTGTGRRDPERAALAKALYWPVVGAQNRTGKFVHALVCASESPDAFVLLLECLPPQPSLSAAGVAAIVAAAWHPSMVTAIANSWIDDAHPGCWTQATAPPAGLRSAVAQQRAIDAIRARYAAAEPDAGDLETARLCYWTPEDRCEALARADGETDTFDETRATTEMHRALNLFVRTLDRAAGCAFGPTKPCADPTHAICRMLAKK